ncbi:hypothetical protein C2G38_2204281 [Gigaspora rosea]|uniref:Matrin-type domain-containing protein n=1 Tax=Gigaspora rosea TaxID=44941 RepID=A0A397ULH3_9GLOM|nr:hypothetical protein C2G38_2204281 [Gigaspora rosea]
MVSAAECRVETSEYKKNFYVDGQKLFCEFCQHVVNHTRKSIVDSHLKSEKHKANVNKAENLKSACQTTLDTANIKINDRELINIALVNAFTKADIPLYKIDKLKSFFLEYCKNGGAITSSNHLRVKYLPKIFDIEVSKLQNLVKDKQISITIDETTDACSRAVIHILFSFNNYTKLAKTKFITTVDSTSIAQLIIKTLQFQAENERISFIISEFTEERDSQPESHTLFAKTTQLTTARYRRMFNCYQSDIDKMNKLVAQIIHNSAGKVKIERDELDLISMKAAKRSKLEKEAVQTVIVNVEESRKLRISHKINPEEKEILLQLERYKNSPLLPKEFVNKLVEELSSYENWTSKRIRDWWYNKYRRPLLNT